MVLHKKALVRCPYSRLAALHVAPQMLPLLLHHLRCMGMIVRSTIAIRQRKIQADGCYCLLNVLSIETMHILVIQVLLSWAVKFSEILHFCSV